MPCKPSSLALWLAQLAAWSLIYCLQLQTLAHWGRPWLGSPPSSSCTMLSSLRKFPQKGQHPLPNLPVLHNALIAFIKADESQRHLAVCWNKLQARPVPGCIHSNVFWFPEQGPVVGDTLRAPHIILDKMPRLQLCSDCGTLVSTNLP
jgi:hypothetical protein